ncbi:hypothetical protein M422DRAFT_778605 [Sphaerobolus stellatus SS14]|uniref:Fungal-type protein kinase domain-containing protein n=1 Tax=Sphaerobolus stellatus (strain SS14) TaxID=990650 RepID=A0A0C9VGF2_SPHS4|nr:hypothetical protein M422DRAFT_778605 [Sphaerobolus stellatus SS14]
MSSKEQNKKRRREPEQYNPFEVHTFRDIESDLPTETSELGPAQKRRTLSADLRQEAGYRPVQATLSHRPSFKERRKAIEEQIMAPTQSLHGVSRLSALKIGSVQIPDHVLPQATKSFISVVDGDGTVGGEEASNRALTQIETKSDDDARTIAATDTARHPTNLQQPSEIDEDIQLPYEKDVSQVSGEKIFEIYFPSQDLSDGISKHFKRIGILDEVPQRNPRSVWRNWPSNVSDETVVTTKIIQLLNIIIERLGLKGVRRIYDCQRYNLVTKDQGKLRPDIFVYGINSSSQNHFPVDEPTQENNDPCPVTEDTRVAWKSCIMPIEIKTMKALQQAKNKPIYQVGTYIMEIFAAQPSRRAVPSLIITERTVQFLLWDRAGVLASDPLDYHQNPLMLCRVLCGLLTISRRMLGFDPYINVDRETILTTANCQKWRIDETVCQAYTWPGNGSTLWTAVNPPTDKGDLYLIHDIWLEEGVKPLMNYIQKLHSVNRVFPECVYWEDVKSVLQENMDKKNNTNSEDSCPNPKDNESDPFDSIKKIRQVPQFMGQVQLFHSRFIFKPATGAFDFRVLENFRTPQELFWGMIDLIKGLIELYRNGFVYDEIVPWNIILQPSAPEGSRAVLYNLSLVHPIIPGNTSQPPPRSQSAQLFASENIWIRPRPHLNFLQSCYYLLYFIIVGHEGRNLRTSRLKWPSGSKLYAWENTPHNSLESRDSKRAHFLRTFRSVSAEDPKNPVVQELYVRPWFGKDLKALLECLHTFFYNLAMQGDFQERPVMTTVEHDFERILALLEDVTKGSQPQAQSVAQRPST